MLSEGRFPLARAAVPQAWRGLPCSGTVAFVPAGRRRAGGGSVRGRLCPARFQEWSRLRGRKRVGGRSRHRASKTVFPAGIRMAGPNGLPPPCGNREVAFLAIRRHGRLSRESFCRQVQKAAFVISIFLSTACGSARRSAAPWDCRPACRNDGLPILRA